MWNLRFFKIENEASFDKYIEVVKKTTSIHLRYQMSNSKQKSIREQTSRYRTNDGKPSRHFQTKMIRPTAVLVYINKIVESGESWNMIVFSASLVCNYAVWLIEIVFFIFKNFKFKLVFLHLRSSNWLSLSYMCIVQD